MLVHIDRSEELLQLRRRMASCAWGIPQRERVLAARGPGLESLEPRTEPLWELAAGTVQEWVATTAGSGVCELALWNARQSLRVQQVPQYGRWLAVEAALSPVALVERDLDLSRVIEVQVPDANALLWTVEQGLRSRGVDMVICRVERLPAVAFRRWKLAVEVSGTRCVVLRGAEALRETSWADLRVQVAPLRVAARGSTNWSQRRWRVTTLKVRNGLPGGMVDVEWNRETDRLRVVSVLADSTTSSQAAGTDTATGDYPHSPGEQVPARRDR